MRQLELADTRLRAQTASGGYKPFNRTGIRDNVSPLLKATFETTGAFVSQATLYGDYDQVRNPSARIVMGRTPESGPSAPVRRRVDES